MLAGMCGIASKAAIRGKTSGDAHAALGAVLIHQNFPAYV
jgi:hypothetical protein